jgi:hypothetical protein
MPKNPSGLIQKRENRKGSSNLIISTKEEITKRKNTKAYSGDN